MVESPLISLPLWQAMMKELRGYAEAASFSTDGLRRAQGALDDFVASAKLENSNGTERLRAAELFHSKAARSRAILTCLHWM